MWWWRNFGIVTSFEYRLHPVGPMILGGMLLYPLSKAKEVLQFYRDYLAKFPKICQFSSVS